MADEFDIEAKVSWRTLKDLGLTVRCRNAFKAEGIETVGQLVRRSQQECKHTPSLGAKSVREIGEKLADFGLSLRF